jgi:3-phenylpropionate/cinnamic acid dioxygenase small subunit
MSATQVHIDELSQLNARYVASIDEDNLEIWPRFFTEQCLYKITTAENYQKQRPAGLIYADSRNMLHDRVNALREANIYERHRYRHIVGTPLINSVGERTIQAETPFLVTRIMHTGEISCFATGKYVDQLLIQSSELVIEKRQVVCDSIAVDTLLAIPL